MRWKNTRRRDSREMLYTHDILLVYVCALIYTSTAVNIHEIYITEHLYDETMSYAYGSTYYVVVPSRNMPINISHLT